MKKALPLRMLFILLLFGSASSEAATIRGHVARQTPYGILPAANVRVTLKTSTATRFSATYSNPQGMYYMYNVPRGQHVLQVGDGSNSRSIPVSVDDAQVVDVPGVQIR